VGVYGHGIVHASIIASLSWRGYLSKVLFAEAANHEGKITVTEAPANGKNGTGNRAGGAADLPMFLLTPGKDLQGLVVGDPPTLGIGQGPVGLVKGRQHGS